MLKDTYRDYDLEFLTVDLASMLLKQCLIQEETAQVNGSDCLVVFRGTPAVQKVYLDIEKNFSVARVIL